jgi:hypothetical protein
MPKDVRLNDGQIDRRIKATLAWYQENLVAAYGRHGRKNVRWDESVRAALGLVAQLWAMDPARAGDTDDQAWYRLRRAIQLGCDDPLVEYLAARFGASDLDPNEAARRTIAAVVRLEQTSYSAYLRGSAFLVGAEAVVRASRDLPKAEWDRNWKVLWTLVDKAYDLLPNVVSDPSVPSPLVVRYVTEMWDHYAEDIQRDRQKLFEMTYPIVVDARGKKDPVLPLLRAHFYADYGWDARGTKSADEVRAGAWPVFFERLEKAEAEAARAVALGSADPDLAAVMTLVAKGLHQDRDELEEWFEVGRRLEPGSYDGYVSKLDWLAPRWYGSDDERLAFARALRRTGNWGVRAPMVLVEAHESVADGKRRYFQRDEVCDELQSLYEDFLKRYPDAGYDRSQYAQRLSACGRWSEAHRQFQLLAPDRVRVGVFGGQARYDAARRQAATRATQ